MPHVNLLKLRLRIEIDSLHWFIGYKTLWYRETFFYYFGGKVLFCLFLLLSSYFSLMKVDFDVKGKKYNFASLFELWEFLSLRQST